jgi:hypothetical protein
VGIRPVFGNLARKLLAVPDPPRSAPAPPLSDCLVTTATISRLPEEFSRAPQRATTKAAGTIGAGSGRVNGQ